MADTGHLVPPELRSTPTEGPAPTPAVPQVTSVANPHRIRLTRLAQDAAGAH